MGGARSESESNRGHTIGRPVQGIPQVELVTVSRGGFFQLLSQQDILFCLEEKQHYKGPLGIACMPT